MFRIDEIGILRPFHQSIIRRESLALIFYFFQKFSPIINTINEDQPVKGRQP